MEDGGTARLDIGSTLKQTRQRLGLEIREVEDRTKIRIKYLRALENQEWDVLPAPAYVRGYLRTYADLLQLDGEVLADEYRRQFEESEPSAQAVGSVLSQRRREGQAAALGPNLPRGLLLVGIVAAIVIAIVIVALITGGS